ncbi:FtsX-like permease family protein [Vibrio vulnificus]|nr:FtsX-like permease family protein [Vibrio vulnificus]EGQ8085957.1 FtsX-like permease family protein [Vibrio vulnificus]EHD2249580.1 FtsX-like permease family protein [Vibrio vulnificus]EHH0793395.1 FtsX-like permease family protein [Vibrio vulnificus]
MQAILLERGNMTKYSLNRRLTLWSLEEIRYGNLWPISVALILIISSVFALSALATRMEQVIVKQGKDALTADTVFVSANPIPQTLDLAIAAQDVQASKMTRFATMAFSDNEMQLVTVKAVEESYPLLGELVLSQGDVKQEHVKLGELWLDGRVMERLSVKVGDIVTIGDADFPVTGVIESEPGLSFNPFQQMPAVYIHQSDVDKTGAIQVGSRVQYRVYLVGEKPLLTTIKSAVELSPSDRWRDQENADRSSEVFERTSQYLSLTVAIVIIMAATTLVLTCQNYVVTRKQTIAMLKSIGAQRGWIIRWLVIQLSLLFLFAALVGLLIGLGLEQLLRIPLKDLLPEPLPSFGVEPFLVSLATAFCIAVPSLGIPLSSLLKTSAVSVMQPDDGSQQKIGKSGWLVLVPVVPMLVNYYNNVMVWVVLAAILILFVVLAAFGLLVSRGLMRFPLATPIKLALSRINRSALASGLQLGAFALSLMLLAIIWLVRTDLLLDWQRTLPADAPNVFALNIADYEKESYLNALDENQVLRSDAYPIIRGRFTEINGVNVKQEQQQGRQERSDAISRELNLTWSDQLPNYNQVLQGEWQDKNAVSVESEVASEMGIKIGDVLTFVINSQPIKATVNTIRKVEWRDMKPNFYFIFSNDVMANMPGSYLVSYRIEENQGGILNQLSRQHPTVSVLDIRTMATKIQSLIEQIVWSISILAILGVIAGVMLIFTLLRLSLSQRQQEIRLYRTLGASKKRVTQTIWAEFGLMAIIASLVATLGAEVAVAGVMHFGFELSTQIHPQLWVMLPLLALLTLFAVVLSLIKQLLTPVNNSYA